MVARLRDTTISEVCALFDGPHATPAKTSAGPIFLGITSLRNGRIDLASVEHLAEEDFARWTRRVTPHPGDVVFSYETKLGEAALIPEGLRCCLGRRMALLRPDPERIDGRFLLYYYLGPEFQDIIRKRTIHGSTVDRLSLTEFPGFPLRIPPLTEQKAIAAVLGALDDKIELNRRMNATLEAMARALFQSWFVDFDPVRAKLEGRAPANLDPVIAALFPASFQDSPLGSIPHGWEVRKLKELTSKIGSGATPRGGSEVYVAEGPALIRSQNVYDHEFHWAGLARLTEKSAAELSNVVVMKNDVLLNITGDSILRTCVVDPAVLPARVNQHVAIIRAIRGVSARYLHLYLVQSSMKSLMIGLSAGATRHAITKGHLEALDLIHPPPDLLAAFERVTAPLFEQIDNNRTQSRTLATLRDTLLPKLLSGELSVSALTDSIP